MPSRRNTLPGAIRQRANGRWQAVITLPRNDKGEYPQISRTFDTRREAEQWRLDQTDSRRPATIDRGMTVAQLLARWLDHQDGRIAATTHHTYRQYVTNRINPNIGAITLDRLSVDDVDDLYVTLRKAGLAPASIRQVHAIVRSALTWGRKRRYVDMNVALDADPPTVPKRKTTAPSTIDVRRLLAEAFELDREFGVAARLAAATGARRGTVAAFRQSDFGFADLTVLVDRSVSVVDGVRHVKGLKHEDSGGRIPVDQRTLDIVHDHLTWLHERARKCGVTLGDDFYLFAEDPACTISVNPDRLTRQWNTVRRRCAMPGVRLHDLRHYVATDLYANRFDPVTVADRLKHSSVNMGLEVYGHVVSEQARAAAEHIGRNLG